MIKTVVIGEEAVIEEAEFGGVSSLVNCCDKHSVDMHRTFKEQ